MTHSSIKPLPSWATRALTRPLTHVFIGIIVLAIDLLTGPFLLFPIAFVLPVTLSAWFCSRRLAYALAVLLPVGRFFIAVKFNAQPELSYIIANALIRVAVLGLLAFLVARTSRQTKALQERVAGLVTVCAWSRTVEYQGEWISFEEYLKRRFNLDASHGISPAQAQKAFATLNQKTATPNTAPVRVKTI